MSTEGRNLTFFDFVRPNLPDLPPAPVPDDQIDLPDPRGMEFEDNIFLHAFTTRTMEHTSRELKTRLTRAKDSCENEEFSGLLDEYLQAVSKFEEEYNKKEISDGFKNALISNISYNIPIAEYVESHVVEAITTQPNRLILLLRNVINNVRMATRDLNQKNIEEFYNGLGIQGPQSPIRMITSRLSQNAIQLKDRLTTTPNIHVPSLLKKAKKYMKATSELQKVFEAMEFDEEDNHILLLIRRYEERGVEAFEYVSNYPTALVADEAGLCSAMEKEIKHMRFFTNFGRQPKPTGWRAVSTIFWAISIAGFFISSGLLIAKAVGMAFLSSGIGVLYAFIDWVGQNSAGIGASFRALGHKLCYPFRKFGRWVKRMFNH